MKRIGLDLTHWLLRAHRSCDWEPTEWDLCDFCRERKALQFLHALTPACLEASYHLEGATLSHHNPLQSFLVPLPMDFPVAPHPHLKNHTWNVLPENITNSSASKLIGSSSSDKTSSSGRVVKRVKRVKRVMHLVTSRNCRVLSQLRGYCCWSTTAHLQEIWSYSDFPWSAIAPRAILATSSSHPFRKISWRLSSAMFLRGFSLGRAD